MIKKIIEIIFVRIKQFITNSNPFIYVAIGDSTVEGIGASHQEKRYTNIIYSLIKSTKKNALLYNLGKSEATTKEVIEIQLKKTILLNPNLVTLSIGANDIGKGKQLSTFKKNLTLIESIKNETQALIIMNNIPNFSLMPAVPYPLRFILNFQIKRFNKVIFELTKRFDIILIDVYTQSSIYAKHFPETIATDNFHPSDFGYALWANTIITASSDLFFPKNILSQKHK